MSAFTAYSWLATTLCAAWFARRFAAERGQSLGLADSLIWQGSIYAAWLLAALVVWLLIRWFGSGLIGLLALYLAGGIIIPLESLAAAMIDARYAPGAVLAMGFIARLPISLLLYTAMVAIALAAAEHRRARQEKERSRALTVALEEARLTLARGAGDAPSLEERLIVISGARRVPVRINEVEWFGAADNYVVVHWSDREGLLRSTLQALEARLNDRLFARCHRSALVNLARVKSFAPLSDGSWRLMMESGAEVVTSRAYRRQLLERLGQ
ncbi:LytTR family DNA-binding domain-containing protein [Caulobacter sp. BP25]|uniref:LytTR family DNA-binding domain-containing protein n=1 Tax=Caulobacter sp. BP25 TaxID=2048900 RepID=UPI000C12C03C|nr:LytTR family DNA-binding domain-containing protein [Caulobacter sp. BP25]PHY18961.1 DNA-binding protein [Caulobacter sp. BP25]